VFGHVKVPRGFSPTLRHGWAQAGGDFGKLWERRNGFWEIMDLKRFAENRDSRILRGTQCSAQSLHGFLIWLVPQVKGGTLYWRIRANRDLGAGLIHKILKSFHARKRTFVPQMTKKFGKTWEFPGSYFTHNI
jgi:hypothetical protein